MRSLKTIGIAAILLGLGLSGALAQQATPPADIPGAFDTLPPGNKSIAESLYNAQTGPAYWTRDQIATAKMSGDGWGQIFQEMKRDGLVTEKSLGQVIRRDAGAPAAIHRQGSGLAVQPPRREVTVTTAGGAARTMRIGNGQASRGNGGGNGTTLTTGNGSHGASAASTALGGAFAAGHPGGQGGGHGNGAAAGRGR